MHVPRDQARTEAEAEARISWAAATVELPDPLNSPPGYPTLPNHAPKA